MSDSTTGKALDTHLLDPDKNSLLYKLFDVKSEVRKLLRDKNSNTKLEVALAFLEILGPGHMVTVCGGVENKFTIMVVKEMEEFDFVIE